MTPVELLRAAQEQVAIEPGSLATTQVRAALGEVLRQEAMFADAGLAAHTPMLDLARAILLSARRARSATGRPITSSQPDVYPPSTVGEAPC